MNCMNSRLNKSGNSHAEHAINCSSLFNIGLAFIRLLDLVLGVSNQTGGNGRKSVMHMARLTAGILRQFHEDEICEQQRRKTLS